MIKKLIFLLLIVLFFCTQIKAAEWTLILFPDTQNDVEFSTQTWIDQCQWVIDNYSDKKSSTVIFHVGDWVNTGEYSAGWEIGMEGWTMLSDAGFYLLTVPGNHDYIESDYNNRRSTMYITNIDYSYFYSSQGWFDGGSYDEGDSTNVYFKLTIQGTKYLFLGLEYAPRANVMGWAKDIIESNEDYRVILLSHDYLWGSAYPGAPPNTRTWVGDLIFNNIVKHHPNVDIILSGHYHLTANRTDYNYYNNSVVAIQYDMQHVTGKGWIRILTFDDAAKQIYVQSYSVIDDEYDTDADFQFTMNYDYDITESTPNTSGQNNYYGFNMEGIRIE